MQNRNRSHRRPSTSRFPSERALQILSVRARQLLSTATAARLPSAAVRLLSTAVGLLSTAVGLLSGYACRLPSSRPARALSTRARRLPSSRASQILSDRGSGILPAPGSRFLSTRGDVAIALITTVGTVAALGYPSSGMDASTVVAARDPVGYASPPPAAARPPAGAGTSPQAVAPRSGTQGLDGVTARGGPGQVVVSWQLSDATPDQVHATISTAEGNRPTTSCVATATGCTFTRLTDGVSYTVTVSLTRNGDEVSRQTATAIPYPAVLATRTTRLWFNPADADSLIIDGGRTPSPGLTVKHLLDRSGSGADAGEAPGRRLPTIGTINGHPVLEFGPSSGMSFPASSLPTGSAPATVYAVAALDDPSAESDCFAHLLLWGTARTNGSRAVLKGCGTSLAFADTFGTWRDATPALAWHSGQAQLIRADFTASSLAVWMDGVSSYTWNQPPGSTLNTARMADGMLGSSPWEVSGNWKGQIAEVIILSETPGIAENSAIMQYLQHKWGV